MKTSKPANQPETLPLDGLSRFAQFKSRLPFSSEKWRQLCREGKAPQPIRMGLRLTVYRNSELHAFLNDPVNYRAEEIVR